mmetsp:Transcript_22293/g.71260  ORF Transcript_22293/g.71260 Transcript_22293/m.71260 type:complete len:265 (+) Transcript_22293:51-845(+)
MRYIHKKTVGGHDKKKVANAMVECAAHIVLVECVVHIVLKAYAAHFVIVKCTAHRPAWCDGGRPRIPCASRVLCSRVTRGARGTRPCALCRRWVRRHRVAGAQRWGSAWASARNGELVRRATVDLQVARAKVEQTRGHAHDWHTERGHAERPQRFTEALGIDRSLLLGRHNKAPDDAAQATRHELIRAVRLWLLVKALHQQVAQCLSVHLGQLVELAYRVDYAVANRLADRLLAQQQHTHSASVFGRGQNKRGHVRSKNPVHGL